MRLLPPSRYRAIVVFLLCALGLAPAAQPQAPGKPAPDSLTCTALRAREQPTPGAALDPNPVLPKYTLRQLSDSSIVILRKLLTRRCWGEARELFFSNYQSSIPDWIVYIDSAGHVYQGMDHATTLWDRKSGAPVLYNQQFVYLLAFRDRALSRPPSDSAPPPDSVQFGRRVVTVQGNPTLAVLLGGLGKAIGFTPPPKPTSTRYGPQARLR